MGGEAWWVARSRVREEGIVYKDGYGVFAMHGAGFEGVCVGVFANRWVVLFVAEGAKNVESVSSRWKCEVERRRECSRCCNLQLRVKEGAADDSACNRFCSYVSSRT